jgi:methionyl-tRNA formyltransferase
MKTIVGFLSRPHGYDALSAIAKSQNYKIIKLYTHKLNPKSQDPQRSIRTDYELFVKKCADNSIPLISIDTVSDEITDFPDCDYILEISWRYKIPNNIINKARIAAFGIHRGKLPDFAGAEPIKQALLNGEKKIVLSAHYLEKDIDAGNIISTIEFPVNYNGDKNLDVNIQTIRDEITPLFSKLVFQTLNILEK